MQDDSTAVPELISLSDDELVSQIRNYSIKNENHENISFEYNDIKQKDIRPKYTVIKGNLLWCEGDPGLNSNFFYSDCSNDGAVKFLHDGAIIIESGKIVDVLPSRIALKRLGNYVNDVKIEDWSNYLIIPGFVDTHIHYPQVDVIASYGEQLLDWLLQYTFPMESNFTNQEYAENTAKFFIDQLLINGTTTACVFCTVHPQSVDAFFKESQKRQLRMIAGKVLMDRNAPDTLLEKPEDAYIRTKYLIEKWHANGRLNYAITPRFAPTSTNSLLTISGNLAKEYKGTWIQTHLAENTAEVSWVKELFPNSRSYLDVYDKFGLLHEKSIYAHSIHLDNEDIALMEDKCASISHCPSSNLYLGSGLFDMQSMSKIKTGIGTDIGGGTSYSILKTLSDSYKVQQLQGIKLPPSKALYLATLGGATSLGLDDYIGSFQIGKEADVVVLNPKSTPVLTRRTSLRDDPLDQFFAIMTLGDDRAISATYILGNNQLKTKY